MRWRTLPFMTRPLIPNSVETSRASWGSAAPAAGSHLQGDVVFNTGAAAEGKVGWVCTVSGVPGTWKAFGVIDA